MNASLSTEFMFHKIKLNSTLHQKRREKELENITKDFLLPKKSFFHVKPTNSLEPKIGERGKKKNSLNILQWIANPALTLCPPVYRMDLLKFNLVYNVQWINVKIPNPRERSIAAHKERE